MKKIIILVALMAMTSSAYASKARVVALGEKDQATTFIEDTRYIFTNPAFVNNYSNTLMMEWGGSATTTASTLSTNADPKAMGGFLQRSGNLTYGVYLGNESNTGSLIQILASDNAADGTLLQPSTGSYLPTADNTLDFFLAGGDSLKWGANLSFYDNSVSGKTKSRGLALGLGVDMGDFSTYLKTGLSGVSQDNSKTSQHRMEGSFAGLVGGAYKMGSNKFYAEYQKADWDQFDTAKKSEVGYTQLIVGAGNTMDITSSTRVFTKLELLRLAVEAKMSHGKLTAPTEGYTAELVHTVLPLMFGFEADAKSWLRFRGSISHNLYSNVKSKNLMDLVSGLTVVSGNAVPNKSLKGAAVASYDGDMSTTGDVTTEHSIANSTTVNAGMTLIFGNLELDGMIGLANANRNPTDVNGNGAGDETASKGGVLALDNLMTRVGMTYKF